MTELEKHCQAVVQALAVLRREVLWKPGRGEIHLVKRKRKRQLPADATLTDYNTLIRSVVNDRSSIAYHYPLGPEDYYAVAGEVGKVGKVTWLVIFGANAILETAFPPDDARAYTQRHGFVRLGQLGDMAHE